MKDPQVYVIHARVSVARVWQIVVEDLPPLKRAVESLIEDSASRN